METQKSQRQPSYNSSKIPYNLTTFPLGCRIQKSGVVSSFPSTNKKQINTSCSHTCSYFHQNCQCSIKTSVKCQCNCYTPSLYNRLLSAPYTKLNREIKMKRINRLQKQKQNIVIINKPYPPIASLPKPNKIFPAQITMPPYPPYPLSSPPLVNKIANSTTPIIMRHERPMSSQNRPGSYLNINLPSHTMPTNLYTPSMQNSIIHLINAKEWMNSPSNKWQQNVQISKGNNTFMTADTKSLSEQRYGQDQNIVTFQKIPNITPKFSHRKNQ